MVGTNETAVAPALREVQMRKSELGMVSMSPGTKMRQSITKQSMFAAAQQSLNSS